MSIFLSFHTFFMAVKHDKKVRKQKFFTLEELARKTQTRKQSENVKQNVIF